MKNLYLILALLSLTSCAHNNYSDVGNKDSERSPASTSRTIVSTVIGPSNHPVCKNVEELFDLLEPIVNVKLIECNGVLNEKKLIGKDEYLYTIKFETSVKRCTSSRNFAVNFPIPTNMYPYWKPPITFPYLDYILGELSFKYQITIEGFGPNYPTPTYNQVVFIPECATLNL